MLNFLRLGIPLGAWVEQIPNGPRVELSLSDAGERLVARPVLLVAGCPLWHQRAAVQLVPPPGTFTPSAVPGPI